MLNYINNQEQEIMNVLIYILINYKVKWKNLLWW
jgi:hypothetical protein